MIEKHPTKDEIIQRSFLACHKAMGSVLPLDIMHMIGAGVHFQWVVFNGRFGCKAMNRVAVLQDEKKGTVLVFEARPEGDTVTSFRCNPGVMKKYYQDQGKE